MATYGTNILPAFSATTWSLNSGHDESISGGVFSCKLWGQAQYYLDLNEYNVGDMALINCSSCYGYFTVNLRYIDIESGQQFNNSVQFGPGGGAYEIPLQSARVNQIHFTVYCINTPTYALDEIASIGTISVQFAVQSNTSGSGGNISSVSEVYPTFYSTSPNKESSRTIRDTSGLSTVASLCLRLNPIMLDEVPIRAWCDISAQLVIQPTSYNYAKAETIACFVCLCHGSRILTSSYVTFSNLQPETITLNYKLQADSCSILDTIQDIPLYLCAQPIATSSSYATDITCIVHMPQTYIKAKGTILKNEQLCIIPPIYTSSSSTGSGVFDILNTKVYPSQLDYCVLYNDNKPAELYMISHLTYQTVSPSTTHRAWFISSMDLLGPFNSDSASKTGSIISRQVIQDDSNLISKIKLTAITAIKDKNTVQFNASTGKFSLGYSEVSTGLDVFRVQLSSTGVLSICKLDGTSYTQLATGVVDFDVVQFGCQNYWYNHRYLDSDTPRAHTDTIGFTIVYITNTSIKAIMYPDLQNTTITDVTDDFDSSAFGTYDVQPPGEFFNGMGSTTYKRIRLTAMHNDNGMGDGGQTYLTYDFGLSLYTSEDVWLYGFMVYGFREYVQGVIGEGSVIKSVHCYFACMSGNYLFVNVYWQDENGNFTIVPSSNTPTWFYTLSDYTEDAYIDLFAMEVQHVSNGDTSWSSLENYYLAKDDETTLCFYAASSVAAQFITPNLYSEPINESDQASILNAGNNTRSAIKIIKLPSGQLASLIVSYVDGGPQIKFSIGLLPRTTYVFNAIHSANATPGYVGMRGTPNTVGQANAFNDSSIRDARGRRNIYCIIPADTNMYPKVPQVTTSPLMFSSRPTAIKGMSTALCTTQTSRSTIDGLVDGLNEFMSLGWLPMTSTVS